MQALVVQVLQTLAAVAAAVDSKIQMLAMAAQVDQVLS
jgi:hypothetical protein